MTTRDAGGPLEVVVDGENGLVCEPAPAAIAEACSWLAANPDQAKRARPRRQADRRARDVGRRRRPTAGLLRVAYFSPLPPERSGIADYSALLLPALEKRLDVSVVRRGAKKPPRGTDVCPLPRRQQPRGARLDRGRAPAARPGMVVLHDFVLHHLVAGMTLGRGDPEGYLDAMQQDAGVDWPAARARRRRPSPAADLGGARAGLPAHLRRPRPRRRRSSATRGTSSRRFGTTATPARPG